MPVRGDYNPCTTGSAGNKSKSWARYESSTLPARRYAGNGAFRSKTSAELDAWSALVNRIVLTGSQASADEASVCLPRSATEFRKLDYMFVVLVSRLLGDPTPAALAFNTNLSFPTQASAVEEPVCEGEDGEGARAAIVMIG
jgi:hypothetical protein